MDSVDSVKVSRINLIECLRKVAPAIGVSPFVPEFHYFRISGERVQAFDGSMVIDATCKESTGLHCMVPKSFLQLLETLDDDEVELICEKDKLVVKTDSVKGTFAILDEVRFEDLVPISDENVNIYASHNAEEAHADLIDALNVCRFAVSKDETSGAICGVRIAKNSVFGTDRYRIMKWELKEPASFECSVPLKFIDMLFRNRDEIDIIACADGEKLLAVLADGTYMHTALLEGDYPDLLQFFPDSDDYQGVDFGDNLDTILKRHINFLADVDFTDKETCISISKDKCTLTTVHKELGVLEEQLEFSRSAEVEVKFVVNPVFLCDVVKKCSLMKYFVDKQLILFENEAFQYLLQTRG